MVPIISGNSLGMKNTSASVLGDEGVFGKAGLGNANELDGFVALAKIE